MTSNNREAEEKSKKKKSVSVVEYSLETIKNKTPLYIFMRDFIKAR